LFEKFAQLLPRNGASHNRDVMDLRSTPGEVPVRGAAMPGKNREHVFWVEKIGLLMTSLQKNGKSDPLPVDGIGSGRSPS
jgi:hypothetical protein